MLLPDRGPPGPIRRGLEARGPARAGVVSCGASILSSTAMSLPRWSSAQQPALTLDVQAAVMGAVGLAAGAMISSVVCWWKPGFDAPAWRLIPAAILANPLMLAALGFMVVDYECVVGNRGAGTASAPPSRSWSPASACCRRSAAGCGAGGSAAGQRLEQPSSCSPGRLTALPAVRVGHTNFGMTAASARNRDPLLERQKSQ